MENEYAKEIEEQIEYIYEMIGIIEKMMDNLNERLEKLEQKSQ
ncbi:MAG: hypothetical protein QXV17_13110 [Candidatus Micrarchaeaceae archaeon]